jgi:CRISPR-associated protein Csd1
MINLLLEYATKHNLVVEPGFAPKTVKWLLWLSDTGELWNVVRLGDPERRNNLGQEFSRCPDLKQGELIAGGVTRSHFLVDTCDIVVRYNAGDDPKKLAKHNYFVSLLEQASGAMPELGVAARALRDENLLKRVQERLEQNKAKPADKITLRIGGVTPVESDRWHDWWRQYRRSLQAEPVSSARKMVCFATGEITEPAATHPKIRGLTDVGGQSTGSVLIGFDKDAFRSYGLDQSANCALSEEAAFAYRAALDDLLANRSYRLAGAKIVYWFSRAVKQEDDLIAVLLGGTEEQREAVADEQARRLLRAIHDGERPDLVENRFYALTLSGSGGRVMVRDWMEGSFEALAQNINRWFEDLSIVHREGDRLAESPRFMAVVGALAREIKDVPPPMVSHLFRCAITGSPLPDEAMAQALSRVRTDILTDSPFHHARLGILKATLIRKGGVEMKPFLNPEHPSPAYHCGRLLAVLASLQRKALPNVEAGVIQRFYAAASATPALVLGRIVRTAQFHLDKVRSDSPGLAEWYESKIASILSAIGDTVPVTLSLEEQSLFALGYYQQMAHDRAGRTAIDQNTTTTEEVSP